MNNVQRERAINEPCVCVPLQRHEHGRTAEGEPSENLAKRLAVCQEQMSDRHARSITYAYTPSIMHAHRTHASHATDHHKQSSDENVAFPLTQGKFHEGKPASSSDRQQSDTNPPAQRVTEHSDGLCNHENTDNTW